MVLFFLFVVVTENAVENMIRRGTCLHVYEVSYDSYTNICCDMTLSLIVLNIVREEYLRYMYYQLP